MMKLSLLILFLAGVAHAEPFEIAGGRNVADFATASGTQEYSCIDGKWQLVLARAVLLDAKGAPVGNHLFRVLRSAENPTPTPRWEAYGTVVEGQKMTSLKSDFLGVDQLLLKAKTNGAGQLKEVKYVKRIDTDGGLPPASPCKKDDYVAISYRARYVFVEVQGQ